MAGKGGAQSARREVIPVVRGGQPAVGGWCRLGGGKKGRGGAPVTPLPAVIEIAGTLEQQPRRTAKTPAQRQRELRERKRQKRRRNAVERRKPGGRRPNKDSIVLEIWRI